MWLSVIDLASYLNIKEKTIYHLVSQKAIPHYRIGKIIRFKQPEIDSWMEGKRADSFQGHLDKVMKPFYTVHEGKPDHLEKEVG
jgi:excisionase family DNA binding protein